MWNFLREKTIWAYGTFHNNETIIWGRIQIALGAAWTTIAGSDLSKIIENPKYLGYALMAVGFITEILRRRGAQFDGADDKDSK